MASSQVVQRNPERTRRRILQAAIRLFARHGLHAVSVDQIVGQAKVFEAALAEVYKRIEEIEFHAVERRGSPREKLSRLLESYFEFLDAEPEFTRMLQWENLEKGRHLTRENHLLTKNLFLQQFQAIVLNDVATDQFRRDLDVTHLLIQFIGLCSIYHSNRFSLSQSLELDLSDPKVKARALNQVLTLVFEGICNAESPAAANDQRMERKARAFRLQTSRRNSSCPGLARQ